MCNPSLYAAAGCLNQTKMNDMTWLTLCFVALGAVSVVLLLLLWLTPDVFLLNVQMDSVFILLNYMSLAIFGG